MDAPAKTVHGIVDDQIASKKTTAKSILDRKKKKKAKIGEKRKDSKKVRKTEKKSRRNSTAETAFRFSFNSSDDETLVKNLLLKTPKYQLKNLRRIRSGSTFRDISKEPHSISKKRKSRSAVTLANQVSSPKRTSSDKSSPPSNKKSVTWGSETRHEYNDMAPVFTTTQKQGSNECTKVSTNLYHQALWSIISKYPISTVFSKSLRRQ